MLKSYTQYIMGFFDHIIQARDWSMRYGTNLAQVMNIGAAAVFIYIFGFNDSGIDTAPTYSAFVPFDQSMWWLVFPAIILFQLIFMVFKSLRCGVLAGFVLLLSVPVWVFVSLMFEDSEVANTGTGIYAGLAIILFIAGWRLVDLYDYRLIVKKRGRHHARSVTKRAKSPAHTASACRDDRRADGRVDDHSKTNQD